MQALLLSRYTLKMLVEETDPTCCKHQREIAVGPQADPEGKLS